MEQNAITTLEKELVFILKEEYSFYQSLYIMLDKQKDVIRFQQDGKLLDIYSEIERCHHRIKKSEEKINHLRDNNPKVFRMATISPGVRKIVNSIVTLVKKSLQLIGENEEYTSARYQRLKDGLGELKSSEKIMKYLQNKESKPHLIDEKR